MVCIQSDPPESTDELREILKLVDIVNPVIALLLEMSARTGLRYSDSSKLKISDVLINGQIRNDMTVVTQKSFSMRMANINKKDQSPSQYKKAVSDAKTASTLRIAFSDQVKDLITDALTFSDEGNVYLFESTSKKGCPYTLQHVNRLLKQVAVDMKLNYSLSTHSFRKSFALTLINNGAKMHVVRDMLGQSSLSSTDHYLKTFISETDDYFKNINF